MNKLLPLVLGTTVLLSACNVTNNPSSHTVATANQYVEREQTPFLSEQEAMSRSERVSSVSYKLDFKLTRAETFHATTDIGFNLKDVANDVTIDLDDATINTLKINGNEVKPQYNKWFITLDKQYLHKGHNTVEIDYSRLHSDDGEGLHRFKDPVDDRVYLYSHFEPAAAQQMFPSFDQPDIKATYELKVTAPKHWHVLSTEPESSVTVDGDNKHWIFPKTPTLSTYNFSLHAGPYKMWQDNSGKYPARLFARQSVADQIAPQMWFKFTHQGFGFFEQYFGIPYPFKKYDQILVPDFLYGAMENAAAVTFDERSFLTGGSLSEAQQENLAQTILHELAHQWFGNLVTMKWWNGLWLNESFAAFMTYHSEAEATEFDYAWRSFYAGGKQFAYFLDQIVTTHPIEVPIPSSANAFDNIDGITYSKGAAVLRQLNFLLGAENFRQGIHNYLTKYAYKNATLDDFIDSLSQAAGRDLSEWTQQWLYRAGVNTLTADYQCNDGKISQFTLHQSMPKDHPVLREQRVNIGLFNLDAQGKLKFSTEQAVTYDNAKTDVAALIGNQCPDLVYPNYQDWGFVKVNLDDKSFNAVKSAIGTVEDPLLRSMLWQALSDSVSDGLLPLNEYIDVLLANIQYEQDYTILRQLSFGIRLAFGYLNMFDDSVSDYRRQQAAKLEQVAWQAMQFHNEKANYKQLWFNVFVDNANSEQGLAKLQDILLGKIALTNVDIHQDLRWDMIKTLNQNDFPGSLALIEAEIQSDQSDNGSKRAIAARASRPDPEQKRYWLNQLNAEKSDYPYPKLRAAMGSLFPAGQGHLHEQHADSIITGFTEMDKRQPALFMRSYGRSILPSICTADNLARLDKAVSEQTELSEISRRSLLMAQYYNQQCLKVFEQLSL